MASRSRKRSASANGEEPIELGKRYREEFRQYLIGAGPLPANAGLAIHVSDASQPMAAPFAPFGGREEQGPDGRYSRYSFYPPGLLFRLFLASSVPQGVNGRLCAVHAPGRPVMVTDKLESLIESTAIYMLSENESLRGEILA